jgi:Flp pilus assembly protein TadD
MVARRLPQADPAKRSQTTPKTQQAPCTPAERALRSQIDALVARHLFSQAIRKLQQALKRDPTIDAAISEAQLWLLHGQHLMGQGRLPRAEAALRQAIELGLHGSSHYELARCLLAEDKEAEALEMIGAAFEAGTLPKDYGGVYLKLLLIQGETETLRQRIRDQANRFAAHQLHWAQGALALLGGDLKAAAAQFRLVMVPVSPGDSPALWRSLVRLQQKPSDGSSAGTGTANGSGTGSRPSLEPAGHPAIEALALREAARRHEPPGEWLDLGKSDLPDRSTALALEVVQRIRRRELISAARLLLCHGRLIAKPFPELEHLRQPLLALAGEQALSQADPKTAAELWRPCLQPPHFDPAVGVKLYGVLHQMDAHDEAEQLVHRLIHWLRKEARRHPHDWPEQRLTTTLAVLHCWIADQHIACGWESEARRSVRQAETLCATHPDVVGRQGMLAALDDEPETAIPLLWQALETGCKKADVYVLLVECLETKGDRQQLKQLRNQYGKTFHDYTAESEVEIPLWLEALSLNDYGLLKRFVLEEQQPTPPLQALRIFLDCATEEPAPGKKVAFDHQVATTQWQALVKAHDPEQQVEILKAIYWMIQKHAKRNRKGVAALQSELFLQICALAERVPAALEARLMLLSVRVSNAKDREMAIHRVLQRAVDPGRLLARTMLELRLFSPNRAFKEVLEDQSERDPENPLLLLARATLHRRESTAYWHFHSKGFELARRLQDSEALAAFRVEEWRTEQAAMAWPPGGGAHRFNNFDADFLELLKQFAKTMGLDDDDPDDDKDDLGYDDPAEDSHGTEQAAAGFGAPKRSKHGRRRKAFHEL